MARLRGNLTGIIIGASLGALVVLTSKVSLSELRGLAFVPFCAAALLAFPGLCFGGVFLHWWAPPALCVAGTAVANAVAYGALGAWMQLALQRDRIRRLRAAGVCERCRYDLTGNVSGFCPECGCPTPARRRQDEVAG